MQRFMKTAMHIALILGIAGAFLSPPAAFGDDGQTPMRLDLTLAQMGAAETPPIPPTGVMALSLRDSIAFALNNNLDIQVEGFNPRINDQAFIGQKAVFDPSAFLELSRADNRAPGTDTFFSGGKFLSDSWDYNTGIRQKILTGGTYELRFNSEYFNAPAVSSSTSFSSRFALTLTQPLLRNFGFDANETGIRIASNNQSISKEQLRLRVSTVVTQVQSSYFDLIFAIQNLEVARQSLSLAHDLVTLNKARVRAGVAAPVEVTQAEAQEAARVQDVINGEKAIQDAGDTLKVIMNLPISGSWGQEIRPTDTPTSASAPIDLDQSIQKAMDNRYEYKSAKLDIANKDLSVRLNRNLLLPDLALTGSVSSNGSDTT
ncbi:MAG: TolC family protein, partial [Fimbriimonadales bacterium]